MSETTRAVFLSYASQDAEAARRICDSLRSGGVEVWFDADGGLEHGDEWDAKIRRQIKECVLFIPVISSNTQAREEGYFRIEWDLAAERARGIASGVPFILPIVIDGTREPDALVPDRFRMVQWTKLRNGEVPPEVQQRFLKLWSHRTGVLKQQAVETSAAPAAAEAPATASLGKPGAKNYALIAAAVAVVLVGVGWWLLGGRSKPAAPPPAPIATPAPVKSIPVAAPRSEARQLADRAFAMSVDKYDSTLDDYNLAESLMQRALALDSSDGEILARSAQLHLMFRNRGFDYNPERIAKGREQAERAIRLVPDSAEAVYALSMAQRYTGNTAASLESLERVITIDPNHARALLSLGSSRISNGKPEEGLTFYARARQQPEWAPLADYFEFLRQFGRRNLAEADRLVRSSYRAGPSANNAAGIALIHLSGDGDLDTAARELAAIPIKLLNAPRIVCVTAFVQLSRRKPEEALKALDRLPDEFVQDAWSTGPKASLVGRAHAMAGRETAARLAWESGLAVIEARLKNSPGDAAFHHSRGMLLAWLGRTDASLQEAHTVQELNRGAAPTWNLSEATIYAALGRADLALPLIDKMVNDHGDRWNWPITVTLLRQDSLWDKIRDEPGFQKLIEEPKTKATPSLSAAPAPKPDDKSVAVLAFADNSPGRDSEYFSDGISEELINALGKVPGLKVPARTSSFYFKGKNLPTAEIAKQLGVAYVIEGSVQRAGDKVKISARLSKAADGFQVWSDSFTRDAKDVFAVEEEIAGLIAKNLSLKLGATSSAATANVNPQALEFYLQASQMMRLRDTIFSNTDRVEELLNRALALEPNFARAHAMLAEIWMVRSSLQDGGGRLDLFGQRNSPERARIEAKARQAIALDPMEPEAHVVLSLGMWTWWDRVGEESELHIALALNPSHVPAHRALGSSAMDDGRMDDAIAEFKLTVQLDPFAQNSLETYARALHVAGRYTEAIAVYDRALAIADSEVAREHKAYALAQLGRKEEAVALARGLSGGWPKLRTLAVAGHRAEAEALLPADTKNQTYDLFVLGRTEEGLASLNPAAMRSGYLHDWLFEPWFDPVRNDPRFKQFLETLGVTEAHARAQAWRQAHPAEKPAATK